jgi:hypothetical protein
MIKTLNGGEQRQRPLSQVEVRSAPLRSVQGIKKGKGETMRVKASLSLSLSLSLTHGY